MENSATKNESFEPSRRNFILTASVAAAAGISLADTRLFAASTEVQGTAADGSARIQLFTAEKLESQISALQAAPANNTIVTDKNYTIILTVEKAKTAKEFEYHEGRDHVFYILDGSTVYQVGGTPKGAHSMGPGEWHAPESEGAATYTLKKGDMLVMPRGTPHMRITEGSVTLLLISSVSSAKP